MYNTYIWYKVMLGGVSDAQHLEMVRSYARVVFYSTSQKNGTHSSMSGPEVRNSHKWHKVTNIFDFGAQHLKVVQGCAHVSLNRIFKHQVKKLSKCGRSKQPSLKLPEVTDVFNCDTHLISKVRTYLPSGS